MNTQGTNTTRAQASKPKHTGLWIGVGLLLGLLCGLLFGEYCAALQLDGPGLRGTAADDRASVSDPESGCQDRSARSAAGTETGAHGARVLLILWLIGIVLIVLVSAILPPVEGASFFSPRTGRCRRD